MRIPAYALMALAAAGCGGIIEERDAVAAMATTAGRQSLSIALAEALREVRRVEIASSAFDERTLPAHLRMRVAVVGTDCDQLRSFRSATRVAPHDLDLSFVDDVCGERS